MGGEARNLLSELGLVGLELRRNRGGEEGEFQFQVCKKRKEGLDCRKQGKIFPKRGETLKKATMHMVPLAKRGGFLC